LDNLQNLPGFNVAAIRAFFDVGPEDKLYVERSSSAPGTEARSIEHGLGLRLRLPYRNPEMVDCRLNGQPLAESQTGGYRRWFANGYTHVQVNIPPDVAKSTGLFVVTCAYMPDVARSYGWTPPREVLERTGQTSQ
jgi:hypothetical protein